PFSRACTAAGGSDRKAVVRDAAVIGNGEPSPPFEQMGLRLRRGPQAWQRDPYGFSSDLGVTASDQRVDAVPTATVTIRVRSIAPHYLHSWVRSIVPHSG